MNRKSKEKRVANSFSQNVSILSDHVNNISVLSLKEEKSTN